MRQTAAIAKLTIQESLRSKALLIPFLFGLVVVASTPFTPAFSSPDRIRVMLSVAMGAISLLAGVIAIFVSTSTVSREIADKRLYTVLTRPVGRLSYIVGKVLGMWAILAAMLLLLGLLTWSLTLITASFILSPSERSSVLAANNRAFTTEVDYYDRTANQLKYRLEMTEYQRILDTSRELVKSGAIPEGWNVQNLIDVLEQSDENLAAQLPNVEPSKTRHYIAGLLAKLAGIDLGTSSSAWQDFFRINPDFGKQPRNPDLAIEVPPGDSEKFYTWSFEGLSQGELEIGLRGQLTVSLFRNPRAKRFEKVQFNSAPLVLTLKCQNSQSTITLEAYDSRRLDFSFVENAPRAGEPFSISVRTPSGPASIVVGSEDLWLFSTPGSFFISILKAMFLSWCIAALLAATGVFAASFLSFPIALMLCMFVFFWGNSVEYIEELTKKPVENPLLEEPHSRISSHRSSDLMSWLTDVIINGAGWLTAILTKGIDSFPKYDGGKYIPQSLAIPNGLLADALLRLLAWRAILLVLLGWLIFRRKEF